MNLEELSKREIELCLKISQLKGTIEEMQEQISKLGISNEYKFIHQRYADMSSIDIEALKRGLFINWYSICEPTFLTGISDLDENAENKIIEEINERLKNNNIDFELIWMIDYYKNWIFAFSRFEKYELFYSKIINEEFIEKTKIDRSNMENRGQMGLYWNSVNQ
ncbi:hypothetical protein [Chryseobacterium balustinum]|jgi:hypothetical protein|uniref:Uncharacterized protein n=1 Tax=Chryseobacterium balustinum TaxID=246 RepID=A0ABY1LEP7_9FLAO|nr:hypothetical protein [Chryseobacterium balustinum]AZB29335.1 hypothetical protein EB354_08745 [Chryseobacterium balustinum]SKC10986.1 hypothetical protein SAMN05421800_1341 [Chryseobacterium balustinum]